MAADCTVQVGEYGSIFVVLALTIASIGGNCTIQFLRNFDRNLGGYKGDSNLYMFWRGTHNIADGLVRMHVVRVVNPCARNSAYR